MLGNQVFAGRPARHDELGVYFQPRAGTGDPVILLGEISEIYEVHVIVPRVVSQCNPVYCEYCESIPQPGLEDL